MLENAVWLLHQTQSMAIQELLQGHTVRVAGSDHVHYDALRSTVTFSRAGEVVARYRAVVLGVYRPQPRTFRWGWVGCTEPDPSVEALRREGALRELTSFAQGDLRDLDEVDAERLVNLGALFAGAIGIHRRVIRLGKEGQRHHYLALFEVDAKRASILQPAPVQTVPPPALSQVPRTARSPRDALLRAVAEAALPLLRVNFPGFCEAIVAICMDRRESKVSFFTTISVIDFEGQLQVIEPHQAVMSASARLIGDDCSDGNGGWQRLVIRLAGDRQGAAVVQARAA